MSFHLLPEHLALLRRMQVIWIPIEGGAPYPSPDETYGSADVPGDAQRILHELNPSRSLSAAEAEAYHLQALDLLPEFIARGSLEPGRYQLARRAVDVSGEQIALLKHLRLGPFGRGRDLPVNVKRPYGNMTAFELDMADILGIAAPLSEVETARLTALHESLDAVLEVWLQQAAIELG